MHQIRAHYFLFIGLILSVLFWKLHSLGIEAIYGVSRGPVRLRKCLESSKLNQCHAPKQPGYRSIAGFFKIHLRSYFEHFHAYVGGKLKAWNVQVFKV